MKFTDNIRVLMEKTSSFKNDNVLPKSFYDRRKEIKQMQTHLDEISAGLRKWVKCESQWVSMMFQLHGTAAIQNEDIYKYFCEGKSVAVSIVEKAQLSLNLKKKYIRSMLTRCDQVEALFLLKNRAERKLVNIKAKENANEWKVHKAQARFEAAKQLFDAELERLNNEIEFLFSYAGESAFGASEIKLFITMQQDFFNRCATCVETEFTPFEYDVNDFVAFDTCRVAKLFPEPIEKSESFVPIERPELECNVTDSAVVEDEKVGSDDVSSKESREVEIADETAMTETDTTKTERIERHVTFDIPSKQILYSEGPQEEYSNSVLQKFVTF